MTREDLNRFLDGDCLVKYDGELYYFDSIAGNGVLTMRDINNDYRHDTRPQNMLHSGLYSTKEF